MKTHHFIMTLGIGAIAVTGYFYASQAGMIQAQGLLTSQVAGSGVTGIAGQQVISFLNQLQSVEFDTRLFTDPEYKSLQDFTVDIGAQAVGRANPFLPASSVVKNQAVNQPNAPVTRTTTTSTTRTTVTSPTTNTINTNTFLPPANTNTAPATGGDSII